MVYQSSAPLIAGHTCTPALYGPGCRCRELGRIMAQRSIDHAQCEPTSTVNADGTKDERPHWKQSAEGLRCGKDDALVVPTPEYLRVNPRWPGLEDGGRDS